MSGVRSTEETGQQRNEGGTDQGDATAGHQLDENRRPTLVAGVPPDYFSEDRQLSGNPIYNWKAMKAGGYEWWLKRFACAGKLFDLVRVDHFIGFANYYTVKADAKTARNGKWVNNDGRALFRTVKKALPNVHIAAENLGVQSERVENCWHTAASRA